jgi:hypothetical protein
VLLLRRALQCSLFYNFCSWLVLFSPSRLDAPGTLVAVAARVKKVQLMSSITASRDAAELAHEFGSPSELWYSAVSVDWAALSRISMSCFLILPCVLLLSFWKLGRLGWNPCGKRVASVVRCSENNKTPISSHCVPVLYMYIEPQASVATTTAVVSQSVIYLLDIEATFTFSRPRTGFSLPRARTYTRSVQRALAAQCRYSPFVRRHCSASGLPLSDSTTGPDSAAS